MAVIRRWVLLCSLLFAGAAALLAAPTAETRAFDAASNTFRLGFFEQAESEFAQFTRVFTNSPRLPEAILYQAEAAFKQARYARAIELLSSHQSQAGKWADEYLYWLTEARFQSEDNRRACEDFGKLLQQYPGSRHCFEAAIGQADACSRLGEWQRVLDLLQAPDGVFQNSVRTNPVPDLAGRGYLLLSEAWLAQRNFPAAEAALQPLADLKLSPDLDWKKQHLLCRIQVGAGHPELALQSTTNLVSLAAKAAQPDLQAESAGFRAGLLERLGLADAAIAAYTTNLAAGVPAGYQRAALLKVTELSIGQGRLTNATQTLKDFLSRYSNAPAADLALVTLGELRLRQCAPHLRTNLLAGADAHAVADSNALAQAMAPLLEFTNRFPHNPFAGNARLALGWCFWLGGKLPEAEENFAAAARLLPVPAEQALARFKLADAQYRQSKFAEALANYKLLLEQFAGVPEVKTNLFEPALYQCVRAALAANDLATATNKAAELLASFPNGFHTDSAALLVAREVSRQGNPVGARELLLNLARVAPGAPLLPKLYLAVARTYEETNDWTGAIQQYNEWLARFTNHADRPLAEYCRARATALAGQETNALTLFTNLVARFPTDEHSCLAQLWVADYYFQLGSNRDAELNYQLVFQNPNWPVSTNTYQAIMMAGRAAFAQHVWRDARAYFTNLTARLECPLDLRLQAMSAYGDTLMSQDSTNKAADYIEAIRVFSRICDDYPTNQQAVLALGQRANALYQLALLSPHPSEDLTNAFNAYQQVVGHPGAGVAVRSMAAVGLGLVLEKQAEQKALPEKAELLKAALARYLGVFDPQKILRDGEEPDRFWRKEAGLRAGRLAEALEQWEAAANVYQELCRLLPSLHPALDERIRNCRERLPR